jgi:hypothetical protein
MEKKNAYRSLVGKPEGKGPLGRQRSRWAENIKMDQRNRMRWLGIGTSGGLMGTQS